MLVVTVEGFDMPGRSCGPDDAPQHSENIHVGMQRKKEPVDLVPGDAEAATWSFEVATKTSDDGTTDFAGPYVHGKRGDRFLSITWGTVDDDGFHMFRRAKLNFAGCDPRVLALALERVALRVRVRMTDAKGNPRCARVRDATWSAG